MLRPLVADLNLALPSTRPSTTRTFPRRRELDGIDSRLVTTCTRRSASVLTRTAACPAWHQRVTPCCAAKLLAASVCLEQR
jgi:hypothetical protein